MSNREYGVNPSESYSRSAELQEKASQEIPQVSSSNYRGSGAYAPYPLIYMEEANGVHLTDVDGNSYLDFHAGVSAIITGHRPERQSEAVRQQLMKGPYFATTHELEYETAKLVNELVPSSERVKFSNTGTEAIMSAVRLARGYTGKDKLLKFEGMYHGHCDDTLINVHPHSSDLGSRRNPNKIPDSVGVPASKMATVESIPWNDVDLLAEKLEREGDDIAAVVTEAVASNAGGLWPRDGYLHELQRLANEHDVLFILDEVVTGFRLGLHGAQGHFDLDPDLAVFGKAIANGYPGSALTGKSEVMEFIDSRPDGGDFMGTFSGNPLVVAAIKANLEILRDIGQTGYEAMSVLGDRLTTGLEAIISDHGFDVFIPEHAGFFYIHFHDGQTDPESWSEYRDMDTHVNESLMQDFAAGMIDEGIFIPPQAGRINLTLAHTEEHVEQALEAAKVAAAGLR